MKTASTVCEFTTGGFKSEAPYGGRPVVLLFADGQSMASHVLERTIHELAPAYRDRLRFQWVSPHGGANLLKRFCISSIPALVVLRDEVVLYLAMGILPRRELKAIFDALSRRTDQVVKAVSNAVRA